MRARLLKPGFFDDEDLSRLPLGARLLFAGLWCMADRLGRLVDSPKKIAGDVFPHDESISPAMVGRWLKLLSEHHITRYTVEGCNYIQVNNFIAHQTPNIRERLSVIPPCNALCADGKRTVQDSEKTVSGQCNAGDKAEAEAEAEAEAAYRAPVEIRAVSSPPPRVVSPLRKGLKPNGNAVRLSYRPEAKAAVVHMLTSWTEGRLGTADGQIAEALLLTIGGDTDAHLESLATWFRSLTRRGKEPGGIQGWGWFPRVLAEDLKSNASEVVNV